MIFKYIKAANFFPDFAPEVHNWKHKMRGFNGRGNHMEFSAQDKAIIKKALTKLGMELKRFTT